LIINKNKNEAITINNQEKNEILQNYVNVSFFDVKVNLEWHTLDPF